MLRAISILLGLTAVTANGWPPFLYTERPVASPEEALSVTVGLSVVDVDVDEAHNTATIGGWLDLKWHSAPAAWTDGPLQQTRTIPANIWTPDIVPYNKVLMVGPWFVPTLVVVQRSGEVQWVPPVSITVRCQHTLTADQDRLVCPITLGSWTHSAAELNLLLSNSTLDTDSLAENGRWTVASSSLKRELITYACCPEPYVALKAELVLKPQRC